MLFSSLSLLYIDPGTGSLLMQIIAGGALVSVMFFKKIWYTVTSVFRRRKHKEDEDD
jgi:hypothetical protein